MLDSSSAHDNDAPQNLVDVYSAQIDALSDVAGDNAWLVAHHPVWGIGEFNGDLFRSNVTLQESTGNSLKPDINLVLSGHIHLFEMLSFEGIGLCLDGLAERAGSGYSVLAGVEIAMRS
jgi:hypothetical protein